MAVYLPSLAKRILSELARQRNGQFLRVSRFLATSNDPLFPSKIRENLAIQSIADLCPTKNRNSPTKVYHR